MYIEIMILLELKHWEMDLTMNELRNVLSDQPRESIRFDSWIFEPAITESVRYLNSPEAAKSIEINPYWPKWNSPWWHLSTLFEMGMADRIPKRVAQQMLLEVKRTHLPYFFREEVTQDKDPHQETPCPCAFGNIYQILSATGLKVDTELPWARGWFLNYQMPDGGLNCDEDAYKADANASSLVGTISPLEAILTTSSKWSPEEERFLDLGAKCLIARELRLGSPSKHNAEERLREGDWLKPCFPRLYFYDVLRGLTFILRWAEALNRSIPPSAILNVVTHLSRRFPNGKVTPLRHSYEGVATSFLCSSGDWQRNQPATTFSLLTDVSELNHDSPFLTAKWQDAVFLMDRLIGKGLIQ